MFSNRLSYKIFLFTLFSFASLIVSCTDTNAIFASIENEEKIESGALPDTATGLGMARIGDNYLIATGGAVYYRHINTSNWDVFDLPGDYEGAIKIVEVDYKNKAYAVLVKDYYVDPSEFALFEITDGNNVAKFSKIRSSSKYMNIWAVNEQDNVFAMVGENKSKKYYENYQSSSPELLTVSSVASSSSSVATTYTNNSSSIVGVAYNSNNSTFYLATEYAVFSLDQSTDTLTYVDVTGNNSSIGYVGGIYYSELYNKLLVSTARLTDAGAYIRESTDNAVTWSKSGKETNTFFTNFIDINQSSFTGILVGTRYRTSLGYDEGYRELDDGDKGNVDIPEGNKYTSGNLDVAGVLGFYVDVNEFFVLTIANGVWRGNYNDGRSVDWELE